MARAIKIQSLVLRPRKTVLALKSISRARTAARQQQWQQAAEHYARALRHDRNQPGIWTQYGHALLQTGQVSEGTQAYLEAVTLSPSSDGFLQLGRGYKLLGMQGAACYAFGKALTLDPSNENARMELAALGGTVATEKTADFLPDPVFMKKIYNIDIKDSDITKKQKDDWARRNIYLSLPHLLHAHNLTDNLLSLFDSQYYATEHGITADDPDDLTFRCLMHFISSGLQDTAALRQGMEFDPEFFQQHYGFPGMKVGDLYRYWLNYGITQGQAPNNLVWMEMRRALEYGETEGESAGLIGNLDQSVVIEALVRSDSLLAIRPTARTADLFRLGAENLFSKGEGSRAASILERLLDVFPHDADALMLYADYQVTLGQYLMAKWCYERLEKEKRDGYQYRLGMVRCALGLGYHIDAYKGVLQLIRDYPAFACLRELRWKIAEVYFHSAVRSYLDMAYMERREEGLQSLSRYGAVVTHDTGAEVMPPRPIRSVALFTITEPQQCYFYRVVQKKEQIKAAGFHVAVYDCNKEQEKFLEEINRFDAVIFYRVKALPAIIRVVEAARIAGLITFYETDDLLFQSQYYPEPYDSYAGQITYNQYVHLAMDAPLTQYLIGMCDYALASTPLLAETMQPFVRQKRAFVHRNAMGSDHERYLTYTRPETDDDVVTIFYGSGTRAHKQDFIELLEPAMLAVAQRHGARVRFVMLGWLPVSDTFRKIAGDRLVVYEPIWDIHEYWKLLEKSDINIAVIKRSLHADAKSEIKWMEAAMFGIPSIVSRNPTYEGVIEDGRTGIMCSTVEEWTAALDLLVSDKQMRQEIGRNAREEVREIYSIAGMAENVKAIFGAVSPPAIADTRKRLLVVNVFYAPQLIGGATRVIHDNILHIKEHYGNEFNIDVMCVIDGAETEYEVQTYVWEGIRVKAINRSYRGDGLVPYHDGKMEKVFTQTLKEFRTDIVHFHCIQRLTVSVVDAARMAGIPYVITVHDSWWISDEQFIRDEKNPDSLYDYRNIENNTHSTNNPEIKRMKALKPALFGAQAILAVSEPFARLYRDCGIPRVVAVENGLSVFPDGCEKTVSPDGRVRLAQIGGMEAHKGLPLIREALKSGKYGNLHLTVVDLSRTKGYRRRETWGVTPVDIIGKVPSNEISRLYRHIDVLLAPSCWFESYGLVTREALAHKCWVVSSDRGAIGQDVTENRNGHVIDVSSARELITVLGRIDSHPEIYGNPPQFDATLRKAGDQARDIVKIYRQILGMDHKIQV
ncbi:glycosyltransferase [Komagataeibacter sp. FNDCF1]|uniref:glycosyltransferase n=1 Tax=Komagataeibacter sp. FNDCF1 TaxID=2878681 RepID=UPI001E5A4D25|nr:glycosyltransferase [Komagataeibacter sp. FNDCF1]